jgi:hypothetical protein
MPKARRKGQPIVKVKDGTGSQAHLHQQAKQNGPSTQSTSAGGLSQKNKKRSRATAFNNQHAKRAEDGSSLPSADTIHSSPAKHKRQKIAPGAFRTKQQGSSSRQHQGRQLQPQGVVDRQAAYAVQALVEADEGRGKGVTLKSLTLAPHITAKKATYKVTCEALKCECICYEGCSPQPCQPE